MMLTDVPECVFGKSIAPLLALDDLYRLAHSSRTMSLIAKQSIQKIVQRDFAMTDLIEQAAYRVVANTGLPIDFHLVKVPGSKVHRPIKFIGTLQNPRTNPSDQQPPSSEQRGANYSVISVFDGHLTVDRGLVWRFPGQEDEVQVKFVFMLPRQESIMGLGCCRITSIDGRNEFILGNMLGDSRNSLDHCGGVSFQQVMQEWNFAATYWEEDRMDYWDRADDDDSVDDDEGGSIDDNISDEVIVVDDIETGQHNTDNCILLGDDDCMIIEDA
jgi:hypothetical protein